MALRHDWQVRIDAWVQAVRERVVRPLRDLPAEFAATMDQLSPAAARAMPYRRARAGMKWGRKWQYGWFRSSVAVPRAARGRAIVLTPLLGRAGTESIVFIDGVARGGVDRWHEHIDLTAAGLAGKKVKILVEAYAGHGPTPGSLPFLLPGRPAIEPPPPRQQTFQALRLCEWDEQAYQLWMDAVTLAQLAGCLEGGSLRRHHIEQAMMDVTTVLDPEAGAEAFDSAVPAAREVLAPVLAARNGDTMPELYCFGHAHIDVAWLWPLAQTRRKAAHTFSTALALMDRCNEFRFIQSQAQLYDYLKADYPEIYARVKRAVRRGQWIAEGGMWVEPDLNIAGGEALIRQFLYGKRFFKDEFGTNSDVCWLPDVFGYNANFPQILAGCGMKYFSTQKLFWNLHGGTEFPYETFTWEGIDGTTVLAQLHRDYNAMTDPKCVARRWALCVDKGQTDRLLYPFGFGDGGGGPTRDHLEHLRRQGDLEGMPRMRQATPGELFAELDKGPPPENRYVGELYLELHRGTLTSQARTKRFNRKCELALREAEMWSAAAAATRGRKYPAAALERTWKNVLLNQFHDILPGSSIERVYAEAEALYEQALADCGRMAASARRSLAPGSGGWTVWNSLSWAREALVAIPARAGMVPVGPDGEPLPFQPVGRGRERKLLTAVGDVPPVGCAAVALAKARPVEVAGGVSARAGRGGAVMENEFLRLRVNRQGEIVELYDKSASRQVVAAGAAMNRLELYRDNPASWDAWDIDIAYKRTPVRLAPGEGVRVAAAGPLEARVALRRRVGNSTLDQQIVLRRGSRRIDFETVVDWRETHRLLKVAFPAALSAVTLRGEIQFGHVIRPPHRNTEFERQRFEWPAQRWAGISEATYGLAVLNDCKYGYDFLDGVLRLSLLRAPVVPDPSADRGRHEFTYALLVHEGAFPESGVVRAACDLNSPAELTGGRCPGGRWSFLELSNPDVIVETVKRAEGIPGTVVRLYESLGATATARLRIAAAASAAEECDMLERPRRKLALARDGSVSLRLGPFEVKTVRFL